MPTTIILVKLADALDVNLDFLLREAENRTVAQTRDTALLGLTNLLKLTPSQGEINSL